MSPEKLLEDIRKLNAEIAGNNQLLFQGLFLLLVFMFSAFLAHALTKKPVLAELLMVLVVSGVWFVVRQELMIHSPAKWIVKAQTVLADIETKRVPVFELRGWETDRKAFWFRPIMLSLSDVLAASMVWYFLIRLRWEYPPYNAESSRLASG